MKCAKCGYQFIEGTTCPVCGHKNVSGESTGSPTENRYTVSKSENQVTVKSAYSMKWYKAMLVILWLGIIGNAISSIMYFTGSTYLDFADEVYKILPSLKFIDIFSGIFCLCLVVFTFIVWRRLKNYRKHAPKLLIILYVLNIVFSIVYMIAFYTTIAGVETTIIYGSSYVQGDYLYQRYLDLSEISFSMYDIIDVIASVVMTIVNSIYFRTRADLFVK